MILLWIRNSIKVSHERKGNMIKRVNLVFIIIWMIAIFSFSSQTGTQSSNISGNLTVKLVDILNITNGCTEKDTKIVISNIEHIVRKVAHYGVYALGGILIYLEMFLYNISFKYKILLTQLLGTIYACTDELHQLFIFERSAQIKDIIIDSCGVFTGIIIAIILSIIIERIMIQMNKNEEIMKWER